MVGHKQVISQCTHTARCHTAARLASAHGTHVPYGAKNTRSRCHIRHGHRCIALGNPTCRNMAKMEIWESKFVDHVVDATLCTDSDALGLDNNITSYPRPPWPRRSRSRDFTGYGPIATLRHAHFPTPFHSLLHPCPRSILSLAHKSASSVASLGHPP